MSKRKHTQTNLCVVLGGDRGCKLSGKMRKGVQNKKLVYALTVKKRQVVLSKKKSDNSLRKIKS